jgi:hypothetical protein
LPLQIIAHERLKLYPAHAQEWDKKTAETASASFAIYYTGIIL